ncbi:MAG: TlpA family protein disulfide reductase [Bacteroidota bacterium]|nr:TlpA family protein disulfide reductase [Bacteroidota bacterium]
MKQILYKTGLFLILLFISIVNYAQSVVISGTAENYKKEVINLYVYEDFISFNEKLIASSTIDNTGNFKITANIPATHKAFLRIDNIAAYFYIENGKTYQVNFPGLEQGKEIAGNINFVKLEFTNKDSKELNSLIAVFNKKYDDFIEENYSLIIRKAARTKINEFILKTKKEYNNVSDPFLKNYINYSIASLEQLSFTSKNKLYKQYLHNKPVLHDNPEYFHFISEFYLNHLHTLSLSKNGAEISNLINNSKDYPGLIKVLQKDTLLQHSELSELVLILGLKEIYNNEDFNKKSINYILKSISEKSAFSGNQKVANQVLYSLTRFDAGKTAPDFELFDQNGNKVSLKQFRGNYVYLSFMANWCNSCLQEQRLMATLNNKYGKDIVFISISTDKKQSDFVNYIKKNNYPWTFLHYGAYKKVLEDYQARALPTYFFISPEGLFIEAPAQSPIGNIEKSFHDATVVPVKKHKMGEK